jgi:hypothetical protein
MNGEKGEGQGRSTTIALGAVFSGLLAPLKARLRLHIGLALGYSVDEIFTHSSGGHWAAND